MIGEKISPREEITLKEHLSFEEKKGYDLLAEVRLLAADLDFQKEISPLTWQYVYFNEKTAALEAATDETLFLTYQVWDEERREFLGYGTPLTAIAQKGLEKACRLARENPQFSFETHRRERELALAHLTNVQTQNGVLSDYYQINISPYPFEAEPELARNLGYHPEEKIAFLRLADFDGKILKVYQLKVAGVNGLSPFVHLIERLTGQPFSAFSSEEILENTLYLPKNQFPEGIFALAKIYDEILAEKTGCPHFLGRAAKSPLSDGYEKLSLRTQVVEEKIEPFLQNLLDTDLELAKSLFLKKPTEKIRKKILYLLTAQDNEGNFLLPEEKRQRLFNFLAYPEAEFSEEEAEIIKSVELVRLWSLIACLSHQPKAEKIFGPEAVKEIRSSAENFPLPSFPFSYLDQLLTKASLSEIMLACGGSLSSPFSPFRENLLTMSLERVKKLFFNLWKEEQSNEKPIKCPRCGWQADPSQAKAIREKKAGAPTACPNCGWSPC